MPFVGYNNTFCILSFFLTLVLCIGNSFMCDLAADCKLMTVEQATDAILDNLAAKIDLVCNNKRILGGGKCDSDLMCHILH